MIGCGIVASVRSDKAAQEELENEYPYGFIYTTSASEHQLPFRVDAIWYLKFLTAKRSIGELRARACKGSRLANGGACVPL
jgi:hypothetical protein